MNNKWWTRERFCRSRLAWQYIHSNCSQCGSAKYRSYLDKSIMLGEASIEN